MNKPLTIRIVISAMLIFVFCQPVFAQEYSYLEGKVQDENGEYMAGVTIEVFSDDIKRATAITWFDGTYVIKPLLSGEYEVRANYPDYKNVVIKDVGIGCNAPTVQNIYFTPTLPPEVTACGSVTPLTLPEPAESVAITGKLKDAFNRPAVNVVVELYLNDTTLWCSAITTEKGCYSMHNVEPGKYTLVTDFNGVKTIRKFVEIKEVSYVNEIVANFYFNLKIPDNNGIFVYNESPANRMTRQDIKKVLGAR